MKRTLLFSQYLSVIALLSFIVYGCKSSKLISADDCHEKEDVFYCADTMCAKIYHGHIDTIYDQMPPDMYYDMDQTITFPLVFKIHNQRNNARTVDPRDINKAIETLNKAYKPAAIQFTLQGVETVDNAKNLQEVTQNSYDIYPEFSRKHDEDNAITIHLLDDNGEYCEEANNIVSCRRVHGFTYILNYQYPNIVLSKPDLLNEKVMPHEMGHFFGLFHTHREVEGEEDVMRTNCETTGDHLCSTPADPGPLYGVYVDYTRCEMIGYTDDDGHEYKPMINNYMSYYYPCYRRSFAFTEEQYIVMRTAALSGVRNYMILEARDN